MMPTALPEGYTKHHIVYLEAVHVRLPKFDFDYDVTEYQRTDSSQVIERIKDATIVITVILPITPEHIAQAPHVQLLGILATGMGWADKPFFANRGITVVNCPQSNVEALGEHFMALYFASRRKIPELHHNVTHSHEWVEKGTLVSRWHQGPPLSCTKEILGIVGYGALGRRFEGLAKANAFGRIIISERKGVREARDGRVTFDELIKTATTIVVCCPFDPSTINLIDDTELRLMRKEALVINMARGGIVNEGALAAALKERRIFGAATDVLHVEPGGPGTTPLLPDLTKGEDPIPGLIVSPHVAWFAERTLDRLDELLIEGVEGFVNGTLEDGDKVKNVVAVHNGRVWK